LKEYRYLLKPEELEQSRKKYKGKLAGVRHRYTTALDGLVRVRIMIFGMALLVFYSPILQYIIRDTFIEDLWLERGIFSIIFLISGLIFNSIRYLSLVLAIIPFILMSLVGMSVYFWVIFILILSGFYYQITAKKYKTELNASAIENQLIE